MVRLDAARAAGGFDERLLQTEDIELWLDLAERGQVFLIPEPLATYDVTGRDEARGPRYLQQAPDRRHTLYSSRRQHLRMLSAMPARRRLTAGQRRVLIERVEHAHRLCAGAARGNLPWRVEFAHRFAALRIAVSRRLVPAAGIDLPRAR
jgi:hypothetical protein